MDIPTDRIANLIPSLGRANDHEVVAAARAIGRILGDTKHDFHDLAARLCSARPRQSTTGWAPAHRAWQAKTDRDRATWLAMYGASALTEWEMGFVDSLVRQLGRRGASASPKQSARLSQIFERVSRAAA